MQPAPFTDKERQILGYIESEWFLRGVRPTPETLSNKFNMTPKALNTFITRQEVRISLESRGIPLIDGRDLSVEQITVINLMLNMSDTRSERKKLADSNISPRVWEGWKRDPKVRAYMLSRTEDILSGAIPDAHLALVERVRSGDMGALKFYYEMTGRYTGQNAGMDPKVLLTRVFDIIAKHVQNPIILQAIASEFQLLAGLDQAGNLNSRAPVAGEVVQGEISNTPVARF
jgi:hypothetical protein